MVSTNQPISVFLFSGNTFNQLTFICSLFRQYLQLRISLLDVKPPHLNFLIRFINPLWRTRLKSQRRTPALGPIQGVRGGVLDPPLLFLPSWTWPVTEGRSDRPLPFSEEIPPSLLSRRHALRPSLHTWIRP